MEYHFVLMVVNNSHSWEGLILGYSGQKQSHIIFWFSGQNPRPGQEAVLPGKASHGITQQFRSVAPKIISSGKSQALCHMKQKINSVGLHPDAVTSSTRQIVGMATFMYVCRSDPTGTCKQKQIPSPVASTIPEEKWHRIKYYATSEHLTDRKELRTTHILCLWKIPSQCSPPFIQGWLNRKKNTYNNFSAIKKVENTALKTLRKDSLLKRKLTSRKRKF